MLICNCTLAGANCVNCSVYKNYYGTSNIRKVLDSWEPILDIILKPNYDEDRYELVEKKDWKLNNLKKELTKLQDTLKEYKDLEKYYANLAVTIEEKINNVESEIKELEK